MRYIDHTKLFNVSHGVEMKEALLYAKARIIKEDLPTNNKCTITIFTDGTGILAESNYDGPWSSQTPGNGIEPPTFFIVDKVPNPIGED